MKTIHMPTTLEIAELRKQFLAQGYTLAPVEDVIIITGNEHSYSLNPQHLHHLEHDADGWHPVLQSVVEVEGGGWWSFDGVRTIERVA
jgi:hypothetical protein